MSRRDHDMHLSKEITPFGRSAWKPFIVSMIQLKMISNGFFFLSTRKFRNFRCARQKVRFTVEQKKTALFPCDQLNYSVKNKPSTINTFIIRNHCFYCSSSCRYDTNRCCCCSFFISNTKSHSLTCINMSKNASLLWLLLLNFTIFACLSSVKWKLCAVSFHFTDSKKKSLANRKWNIVVFLFVVTKFLPNCHNMVYYICLNAPIVWNLMTNSKSHSQKRNNNKK